LANILDRFKFTSVGSAGRILDYNSILSSNGDFTKLFDIDAIINSWRNILSTPKGSYDHDPEFGSNLYLFVFEPADVKTKEAINNDIIQALSTYDNRANISSIDTTFLRNMKGFNVSIYVDYEGDTSNLNINIDENTYQNFI